MTIRRFQSLSDEQLDFVDAACSELEEAWQKGEDVAIEQHYSDADPGVRSHLFRELLAAELEIRRLKGESPAPSDYEARFPDETDQISQAFKLVEKVDQSAESTTVIAHYETIDPAHGISQQPSQSRDRTDDNLPQRFGRYELQRLLGRGGMGSVYMARDLKLDRNVAIKFPDFGDNPQRARQAIERFHREARSMATVEHPNLCPIFDFGETDKRIFLTMSYIQGESLSDRVSDKQPMAPAEAVRIMERLADAVQAAHDAGIVHRDLKPANVMMNSRDDPIVLDFGLATRDRELEPNLTSTGMLVGSPAYMAPEQVEARHSDIGPRSDVYALGVILYELLCGRRPFQGDGLAVLSQITSGLSAPPPSTFADVSSELDHICQKAIAPDLNTRYGSASDLRDALIQLGDGATSRARPLPGMKSAVLVTGILLLFAAVSFGVHRAFIREQNLDVVGAMVPRFDFLSADYSVLEGNVTRQMEIVELTRDNVDTAETVEVALVGDTASAGRDFTAGPVIVHFAEGESTRPVPIELLGDTDVEPDESLRLSLTHFSGSGQPGTTHPSASLTIQTDDAFVDFSPLTGQSNGTVTACGMTITLVAANVVGDSDGHLLASTITADTQTFYDRFPTASADPQIFPALRLEDSAKTDVLLEFSEYLPAGASLIIVDLDGHARCEILIDEKPPTTTPEQIRTNSGGGEVFPGFNPENGQLTAQGIPSNDEGTVFDLSGASTIRIKSSGSGGFTRVALFLPVFDCGLEIAENSHGPGTDRFPAEVSEDSPIGAVPPDFEFNRKIAEWVLSKGGHVLISTSRRNITKAADLPADDFVVWLIYLSKSDVTDEDLSQLCRLRSLTHLLLTSCGDVTDAGLTHLCRIKSLMGLSIASTAITAEGIADAQMPPRLFALDGVERLQPSHLRNIRSLQSLQILEGTTHDEFLALASMPRLRILDLSYGPTFSKSVVADAMKANPLLRVYGRSGEYEEMSRQRLRGILNSIVSLGGKVATSDGAYDAGSTVPAGVDAQSRFRLKIDFTNQRISNDNLRVLEDLGRVHNIVLNGTQIGDEGLDAIRDVYDVRRLDLKDTQITDASLPLLAERVELTNLDVRGTRLTADAVGRLQRERPRCKIESDFSDEEIEAALFPDASVASAAQMYLSDHYHWTEPQQVIFEDRGNWHETTDPFVSFDGQEFYVRTWSIPDERFDLHVSRRRKNGTTWGTLDPIPSPIGNPSIQRQPALSSDGLTLAFASDREGGVGRYDIWFAQRDNLDAPFGKPFNAGFNVNSDTTENNPRLSDDGLTLLFVSYRPDGKGSADLWMCRRDSVTAPFQPAQNLSTVNTSGRDDYFAWSSDGTVLLLPGDEFRMYTRQSDTDSFSGPVRFMPELDGLKISGFSLSGDAKTFYFSCKCKGVTRLQIWMSHFVVRPNHHPEE